MKLPINNRRLSRTLAVWARQHIELAHALRSPAVWIATAAIVCMPGVLMRVLATVGENSPTSEMLQTGVRLLALTFVLPFSGS